MQLENMVLVCNLLVSVVFFIVFGSRSQQQQKHLHICILLITGFDSWVHQKLRGDGGMGNVRALETTKNP